MIEFASLVRRTILPAILALTVLLTGSGCSSMYYSAWEAVGTHKRDIVVDRVEDALDAQEDTKEDFQTAYERFKALMTFDGGELESKYNKLSDQLENCEERAEDLNERIDSIEEVSNDLFTEWEEELEDYKSVELRRSSERQLRDTRRQYDTLIRALRQVEDRMTPVLDTYRDQVLFLKHNLNARAIASLEGTLPEMEEDVARLVQDMEQSIDEANSFLQHMKTP